MEPFERYRSIIDDFTAFQAACQRPLPSVVRVNPIKATPDQVAAAFDETGVPYEQVEWHDGLFGLPAGSPGSNWPSFCGWTQGQEAVSALPPLVLDPQPGERIFDACAAPGSKATQIAGLMEDTGRLVANDNNLGRLSALRFNAERLGVTNIAVTNTDARNYSMKPFEYETFDRVLVDAPCSCEGTVRKNSDIIDEWNYDHITSVAGVQKDILERAIQLAAPGGRVVYSTCTFAPEENEAVLDHVLTGEDCRLVDQNLPLESSPGITEWEGETFSAAMARADRIYPHQNDTGGFFIATLEVSA